MIQLIWKNRGKIACASLLVITFACGDSSRTGDDAGEENRENPNVEKQDETGDLPPTEKQNQENGTTPGQSSDDSTTTDSTQITPRSNS